VDPTPLIGPLVRFVLMAGVALEWTRNDFLVLLPAGSLPIGYPRVAALVCRRRRASA
jgi:hypothetical protein